MNNRPKRKCIIYKTLEKILSHTMYSMEMMNIYVILSIDTHTHTHANFPEQNHIMRVFVCCGGTHKTEKRVRFCLSYFNINVNKFG